MLAALLNISPANRRALFAVYLTLIVVGLLWPGVQIEGPIPRPDLIMHFSIFGLLTCITWWSGITGERTRWASALRAAALSAAVGAITENLQRIEIIHRTFGWDDMTANMIGAAIGLVVVLAIGVPVARRLLQKATPTSSRSG